MFSPGSTPSTLLKIGKLAKLKPYFLFFLFLSLCLFIYYFFILKKKQTPPKTRELFGRHIPKMAESHHSKSGGGILAKAQKRLNRTKAKMLQNFGKATRTTDQIFDEYVSNFNKQQAILTKLHKDLRNYTQSVKALCHTNKVLCDTMVEVYEDEWTEQLTFKEKVESFELLWNDYASSLNTRVQDPIQKQLNRFPDLRGKINKRGRKLVDLDNSRHVLENLTNQRKKDETKITKAQEDLTESQKVFDEINENLHIDLPEFYDDRIRFYSTIFRSLFAAESVFHSEMGQLLTHLIDVCEKLSANHVALRKKRPVQENNHISFDSQEANQSSLLDSDENSPTNTSFRKSESDVYENVTVSGQERQNDSRYASYSLPSPKPRITINSPADSMTDNDAETTENTEEEEEEEEEGEEGAVKEEEDSQAGFEDDNLYQVPPSNQPIKKPPDGALYSVQTTHPYTQGDTDELTFEAREIIYVMEPDNPDEMDEGWLMGIKQSDGAKGVFPENFTVKLSG